jgi:hypothetical protein
MNADPERNHGTATVSPLPRPMPAPETIPDAEEAP